MNHKYDICCDGIDGYEEISCQGDIFTAMELAESILKDLGGGHADIYDEEDVFIQDVEV